MIPYFLAFVSGSVGQHIRELLFEGLSSFDVERARSRARATAFVDHCVDPGGHYK